MTSARLALAVASLLRCSNGGSAFDGGVDSAADACDGGLVVTNMAAHPHEHR